jgi:serine/threonine protein kinase
LIEKHKLEKNIYAERDCMVKCQHPFIVQLHYCYQTSTNFHYGMDFLPGGDLYSLISRNKLSLFDVKLYLCEIGMALAYLHSKGFVYRDLKPENILIDEDGHIKLSDFGLAKNIQKDGFTKSFCGTANYIAPEMISGFTYDYMVDWWSFGIVAYILLCEQMPYYDENRKQLFHQIQNVNPIFPESLDKESLDFLTCFLVKNPNQRSTFESSCSHPFWKDLNFDQVMNKKYSPEFVPEKSSSIEEYCKKYFSDCENENFDNGNEIFKIFDHFSFVSESY